MTVLTAGSTAADAGGADGSTGTRIDLVLNRSVLNGSVLYHDVGKGYVKYDEASTMMESKNENALLTARNKETTTHH